MEQFSLEEYLKNPDREVLTRKGQRARIICTDRKTGTYDGRDVVVLVHRDGPFCKEPHEEVVFVQGDTGRCLGNQVDDQDDLFFGPKKNTGWINVYREGSGYGSSKVVYGSKKEAVNNAHYDTLIATVQIEWEE